MTFEKLSMAAAKGTEPPDMSDTETILYFRLRDLYAAHRAGQLTKDQAARKKADLLDLFDERNRESRLAAESAKAHIDFWKKAEQAAIAYAGSDDRTPAGDALYKALYGMLPGMGTAKNGL
jgi:hypothetical protein